MIHYFQMAEKEITFITSKHGSEYIEHNLFEEDVCRAASIPVVGGILVLLRCQCFFLQSACHKWSAPSCSLGYECDCIPLWELEEGGFYCD